MATEAAVATRRKQQTVVAWAKLQRMSREWKEKPPFEEYGSNELQKRKPKMLSFPIRHNDYVRHFGDLDQKGRKAFLDGQSVVFHCDKGETRAPCLAAMWLASPEALGILF